MAAALAPVITWRQVVGVRTLSRGRGSNRGPRSHGERREPSSRPIGFESAPGQTRDDIADAHALLVRDASGGFQHVVVDGQNGSHFPSVATSCREVKKVSWSHVRVRLSMQTKAADVPGREHGEQGARHCDPVYLLPAFFAFVCGSLRPPDGCFFRRSSLYSSECFSS